MGLQISLCICRYLMCRSMCIKSIVIYKVVLDGYGSWSLCAAGHAMQRSILFLQLSAGYISLVKLVVHPVLDTGIKRSVSRCQVLSTHYAA